MTEIIPGNVYEHYKGGTYKVICVAKMESTGEKMVVYSGYCLYKTINFCRPMIDFTEVFSDGTPRFELVGNDYEH